jgi:demethylmenaquinone methyltransferase/2-methoxy-6-polyprenyl-1,4-benzoquinol methylase
MTRVVRPGGRVVVLEITTPTKPPLSTFFSVWFDHLVPLLGRLSGEDEAYTYLPNSVKRFPAPGELAARMAAAGLTDISWILTAGGIIAVHAGTKLAEEPGA